MPTAFIVEDSKVIQRLYDEMLVSIGFDVVAIANNGQEAIEIFQSLNPKPDIILIDHIMPVKDGIETIKEIIKMDKTSKIIMTSADTRIKNKALEIGAYMFLDKTFRLEVLKNIYNEFLS